MKITTTSRPMANKYDMLEIIDHVLRQKYKAPEQNVMKEKNRKSNGRHFTMTCNIHDYHDIQHLLYRFDISKSSYIYPYFEDVRGYHRMCDYIIFAESSTKLYVLLVELKNTTTSPKKQLDLSEQFMKFVIARMKYLEEDFNKEVEFYKIGVKSTIKMTTKWYTSNILDNGLGYIPLPDCNNLYLKYILRNH